MTCIKRTLSLSLSFSAGTGQQRTRSIATAIFHKANANSEFNSKTLKASGLRLKIMMFYKTEGPELQTKHMNALKNGKYVVWAQIINPTGNVSPR